MNGSVFFDFLAALSTGMTTHDQRAMYWSMPAKNKVVHGHSAA